MYVCACVCLNSSLKTLSQLKTIFPAQVPWNRGGKFIQMNQSDQICVHFVVSLQGWGLLAGTLPQIWPGSARLLAGL